MAPAWFWLLPRFDPRPGVPLSKRFRELDYVGAVLICGAYVALVFAVDFGGTLYAWNSGRVIALFVVSGVLFISFGVQQGMKILTTADRRIFPVQFLRSRTMIMLFAATACGSTATFIPIYFIPLFFQFARGSSALSAGVHLLPYVIMLVIFCVANGGIMSATGYYMPWYLGGAIFTIIGNALLYTVNDSSTATRVYGYTVLAGIGAGAFVQAGFSVAQVKVDPVYIPLAIGFITAGQIAGATISLAIANSVFLNGSTKALAVLLPHEPIKNIQAAVAGAGSDLFKSLDPQMKHDVIVAIIDNVSLKHFSFLQKRAAVANRRWQMKKVYILAITAGALLAVMSVFMKREKLFMKPGAAAG